MESLNKSKSEEERLLCLRPKSRFNKGFNSEMTLIFKGQAEPAGRQTRDSQRLAISLHNEVEQILQNVYFP